MKFTAQFTKLPVSFCGQDLFVSEWSAGAREEFEANVQKYQGKLRAFIAFLSLVDAEGNRVVEDIEELNSLPFSELHKVTEISTKLNLLNQNAIDDLEKN